jgi:hypothetical protein
MMQMFKSKPHDGSVHRGERPVPAEDNKVDLEMCHCCTGYGTAPNEEMCCVCGGVGEVDPVVNKSYDNFKRSSAAVSATR